MQTLMFILGFIAFCAGIHSCLLQRSDHELEQAALLPFADDLEAARNMTAATGRLCERVVTPALEAAYDPDCYRLDA
ncbi:hypothetical protein D3879_23670 [Pseudomonas cavernicola]|uniref:Uncharacterized protein n=1 Tax=Pseudomonas cavernicola TaxID=2320866 RepID=A0A418X8R1_9PSED|nr:hypothetical protein [Pseudomonas cavernicola]RJG08857.1 hypothetical protein D3879_23670 [Pseudomonas cavernicola]